MTLSSNKYQLASWIKENNNPEFLATTIDWVEKRYRKNFDEGKDVTALKHKHEEKLVETLAEKALGEMGEEVGESFHQKLTTQIIIFLVYSNYEFNNVNA